tara:strand:+ start:580 stop:1167 length:588 start_codon:yes stop_codon:yes gene_type:complete
MNKELIFQNIPDKREYKETTSLKFKEDLLHILGDMGQEYTCLEVGTNHGHTTRILSFIFKHVITMDWREEPNLRMAKELNHDRDNITYIQKDVYTTWDGLGLPNFQIAFIDCGHTREHVISDVHNCIRHGSKEQYMIFDDYGHPKHGVKDGIDYLIKTIAGFNLIERIGEVKGSDCNPNQEPLIDSEGIICKYEE